MRLDTKTGLEKLIERIRNEELTCIEVLEEHYRNTDQVITLEEIKEMVKVYENMNKSWLYKSNHWKKELKKMKCTLSFLLEVGYEHFTKEWIYEKFRNNNKNNLYKQI